MKDCLRIAAWEGREACFSFFVFVFFPQEGGDADGWTEVTVRYSSCTLRRWCLDMAINQALFRRPIYSLLLPAWQINNNPCQPGPFPRHDQKADWTRHSCLLVGNSKICCMRLNMAFILLIFLIWCWRICFQSTLDDQYWRPSTLLTLLTCFLGLVTWHLRGAFQTHKKCQISFFLRRGLTDELLRHKD